MIRHALLAAAIAVTGTAATAQTEPFQMPKADDAAPTAPEGSDRFRFPHERSGESNPLDDFMLDMFSRAQPHLEGLARDMGGLLGEYAPIFDELSSIMDDIENYQLPPERLPNGDILIRRKAGAPPPPPLEQLPNLLPNDTAPAQPGKPVITNPDGTQIEL